MKTLKLIALTAISILFASCKATQPTGPTTSTVMVTPVAQTLDTIEAQLYLNANSTNGDDYAALQLTANWLQKQPNIQSVSMADSSHLFFTLPSGLTGMYYLDEVDDSGISLSRGAPGGGGTLERWSTLATNTIKNNNVLIFAPVFDEFYNFAEFQAVLNTLQNSSLGLSVTTVRDDQCTADIVNSFGNYGLVIMDTHGIGNGFLIGTTIPDTLSTSENGLKEELNVDFGITGYDNFQAGQIMLSRGLVLNPKTLWQKQPRRTSEVPFKVVLTSKYVMGLPSLAGTVVFGNFCFSGQSQSLPIGHGVSTAIQTAFMSLNPISYYGYAYAGGVSASVLNSFAKAMEDSVLNQLITNTDSTGHCYLSQDGTEYIDADGLANGLSNQNLYLEHAGQDNWSYAKCGDTIVDVRDGQKYATVCIGGQQWMAQNLNYNAPGSYTYSNSVSNGKTYGRLYDWATLMQGANSSTASPSGVQGVCPKGWHIPSNAEYVTMVGNFGSSDQAGGALKSTSPLWSSPNAGATNSSGFSGLPGGYASDGPPITFYNLGVSSQFTTSQLTKDGDNVVIWTLDNVDGSTGETATPTTNANSCGCVKDP